MKSHLIRYTRLIESLIPSPPATPTVESLGHTRAVHRPLMIYRQFLTCNPATDDLRDSIATLDDSIWSMLALHVAGELFDESTWIARASSAFENLIDHQQPSGEFLPSDQTKNPELRWYEELTTLHAAASYAMRAPSPRINCAVRHSAEYHLQQTQPDHATSEPWGLLAFVQYASPLADQILHAVQMQYPNGIAGIPLLLLQDALYGLQRTTDNGPLTNDNQ